MEDPLVCPSLAELLSLFKKPISLSNYPTYIRFFFFTLENSESLEMHIFAGGSKLQIARSQLSDSGTYACVASNVEGKARKSYVLTVQGEQASDVSSQRLSDSIKCGQTTCPQRWRREKEGEYSEIFKETR